MKSGMMGLISLYSRLNDLPIALVDEACDEEDERASYFERLEASINVPDVSERQKIFGLTDEQVSEYRRKYLESQYESAMVQKHAYGEKMNTDKLTKEYHYRYETNELTQAQIELAHTIPIQKFVASLSRFVHCPFHEESTPSLHITGNKFHCFGCKSGGDTIQFIMKRDKLTFVQAIKKILQ